MLTVRSDHGGGPKHILSLLESLHRRHQFLVAAPENGIYFRMFEGHCSDSFGVPHRQFSVIAFFRLCLFARRHGVELIHSHGRGAGYYSRLLRLFLPGVKVIHTHHGFYYQRLKGVKRNVLIMAEKIMSHLTDAYVFVSPSESKAAASVDLYYPEKSFTIPNGVAAFPFVERAFPFGMKKLIAVTRLETEKGNDILLRIVQGLLRERSDFLLRIVGDGPERKNLENMACELGILSHVEFLGTRNDVAELLSGSDIFVSASLGEAQGIAVVEAMMHGVPVVASKVMGHVDIVEHENNGLLFDSDSAEEGAE
ncbi:MAG TPA: glycosyltransferase family 4 protein [Burkholderiales bacterium]|nr:glycosyltransferase family 4 protein [Burkholderiales bacterium]